MKLDTEYNSQFKIHSIFRNESIIPKDNSWMNIDFTVQSSSEKDSLKAGIPSCKFRYQTTYQREFSWKIPKIAVSETKVQEKVDSALREIKAKKQLTSSPLHSSKGNIQGARNTQVLLYPHGKEDKVLSEYLEEFKEYGDSLASAKAQELRKFAAEYRKRDRGSSYITDLLTNLNSQQQELLKRASLVIEKAQPVPVESDVKEIKEKTVETNLVSNTDENVEITGTIAQNDSKQDSNVDEVIELPCKNITEEKTDPSVLINTQVATEVDDFKIMKQIYPHTKLENKTNQEAKKPISNGKSTSANKSFLTPPPLKLADTGPLAPRSIVSPYESEPAIRSRLEAYHPQQRYNNYNYGSNSRENDDLPQFSCGNNCDKLFTTTIASPKRVETCSDSVLLDNSHLSSNASFVLERAKQREHFWSK